LAPLDLRAHLDAVPSHGEVRGMYFVALLEACKRLAPSAKASLARWLDRRFVAFRSYSLRDYLELSHEVATALYPRVPPREALRRLGWQAYPTFASSMVGRVVMGVFGSDLERIFAAAPRAYELSVKPGRAESHRMGAAHYRVLLSEIYNFVDSYQVGVLEGAIRHADLRPDVDILSISPIEALLDVRWS
jgi:uncharacterized protein (TIGR02265 family)